MVYIKGYLYEWEISLALNLRGMRCEVLRDEFCYWELMHHLQPRLSGWLHSEFTTIITSIPKYHNFNYTRIQIFPSSMSSIKSIDSRTIE